LRVVANSRIAPRSTDRVGQFSFGALLNCGMTTINVGADCSDLLSDTGRKDAAI